MLTKAGLYTIILVKPFGGQARDHERVGINVLRFTSDAPFTLNNSHQDGYDRKRDRDSGVEMQRSLYIIVHDSIQVVVRKLQLEASGDGASDRGDRSGSSNGIEFLGLPQGIFTLPAPSETFSEC